MVRNPVRPNQLSKTENKKRMGDRGHPPSSRDGLSVEVKETNGGDASGIVEARRR
jgi:hypothetical protein